ncbi:MAG: ATP-binding protein, partial [Spirochaetota bacterium]
MLTGPRQTGKTSLLEHCFPDLPYVSLDAGSEAESALGSPGEFLDRLGTPAIIDEIQYVPSLLRFIKVRIDQNRANGQYVLSGSQVFPLMQGVAESLAGRAAVLSLTGLSGDEWRSADLQGCSWEDFFFRGSYPALWAQGTDGPGRERWYQSYVATYLVRDVRNALKVGSLRDFERFLRAAATLTGQMLNLTHLARDVGIAPSTAGLWLQVLVASHQVFLLEPYHRSLGKRLVKTPKLNFTDPGLAHFLAGFSSAEALRSATQVGAFFENYVVGQWVRYRDWVKPQLGLWFWRDQSANEVDLILELDGHLVPIEIKHKER